MENNTTLSDFIQTEGNDLALLYDRDNSENEPKIMAIQPSVAEAFHRFTKEISDLSDKFPMKTKVKVILFVE